MKFGVLLSSLVSYLLAHPEDVEKAEQAIELLVNVFKHKQASSAGSHPDASTAAILE